MRPDHLLDRGGIEVADRDHGHQVGPIPVGVELLQPIVLEVVDDLHGADRDALGVTRALQHDRQLLVLHPGAGAAAQSPLFLDDAALLVDLRRVEGTGRAPSPRGSGTRDP